MSIVMGEQSLRKYAQDYEPEGRAEFRASSVDRI